MYLSRLPALRISRAVIRAMGASAFVVGLASAPVRAAEFEYPEEATSWGLGIGAASSQDPYTNIDRESDALPLIYYENTYVMVFGPTAELKLPGLRISDTQRFNFSIVATYDESGYEEGDARILDGMDDRDGGFWAGAKVEWENEVVNVSAEWLADASGDSEGQQASLGLERTWEFGEHIMLTPWVAATWLDKDYVDYYFGVRDSEARFDRPTYDGKSTVNTEIGVRGTYMFDQRHSVFLDLEAVRLGSEIKDSPLVDRSTANQVVFGYLYRFE